MWIKGNYRRNLMDMHIDDWNPEFLSKDQCEGVCGSPEGCMGADLITLASMLRIPVVMHNVEEERIFRPHAWGSFGTRDTEAADMAACKAYGPLYG